MAVMRNNVEVLFTVEKGGVLDDIQMMLERLSDASLGHFLADKVDPYLQDRMDARFIGEGDDAVKQWLPLATATEAIRQAKGFGGAHPINERTGVMHNFLTHEHGEAVPIAGGAQLTFPGPGMDPLTAEKIQTAQQGKSNPNTPARPVLGMSAIDEVDITDDLVSHILGGARSIVEVNRL